MPNFTIEQFSALYLPLLETALNQAANTNSASPTAGAWYDILSGEAVMRRLCEICGCLIENAKRFNLTAITEPSAVVEKHIIDSLLPLVYLSPYIKELNIAELSLTEEKPKNSSGEDISKKITPRIIDIGSGAGFPSLPLGSVLCDKGFKILAIDSTAKKVRYIQETAEKIGISSAFQAESARAEELAHTKLRESFGIATARAVASLPVLVELCGAFTEPGGYFAAMKGRCADEVEEAKEGCKKLGFAPCTVIEYALPCGDSRSIALYQKIRRTEIIYPRQYAKITAKPLS